MECLFNYGWTFYYGCTFQISVNFWIMGVLLISKWIFWIMGNILNYGWFFLITCDLLNYGWFSLGPGPKARPSRSIDLSAYGWNQEGKRPKKMGILPFTYLSFWPCRPFLTSFCPFRTILTIFYCIDRSWPFLIFF